MQRWLTAEPATGFQSGSADSFCSCGAASGWRAGGKRGIPGGRGEKGLFRGAGLSGDTGFSGDAGLSGEVSGDVDGASGNFGGEGKPSSADDSSSLTAFSEDEEEVSPLRKSPGSFGSFIADGGTLMVGELVAWWRDAWESSTTSWVTSSFVGGAWGELDLSLRTWSQNSSAISGGVAGTAGRGEGDGESVFRAAAASSAAARFSQKRKTLREAIAVDE